MRSLFFRITIFFCSFARLANIVVTNIVTSVNVNICMDAMRLVSSRHGAQSLDVDVSVDVSSVLVLVLERQTTHRFATRNKVLSANCCAITNDLNRTIVKRSKNDSLRVVDVNLSPEDSNDVFGTDLAQWNESSVPGDMWAGIILLGLFVML